MSKMKRFPEWTIHGLWPSKVAFCGGHKFDLGELTSMIPSLRESWPSYTGQSDASFWRYQFSKHGACAVGSPRISNVSAYYRVTVDIYRDAVKKALNHLNIQRGMVDVGRLEQLFRHRLGKSVRITCRKSDFLSDTLAEVRICYSRLNFALIDCPGKSNCGSRTFFAGRT